MANDNIFSGLKVVELANFIAAPTAAVILSDFGADVIKVEPPSGDTWRIGYKVPPQPRADVNYPWHLANRNKRGVAINLKSTDAGQILERLVKWADVLIVNTPHPARKRLHLEYEDVAPWNPRLIYADLTGYGDKGPDKDLPGFDITAYWSRTGLLSLTRDAGAPPTMPVNGSGDHATAVALFSVIVMGLYRREQTGKGSYVTTSLIAEGVFTSGVPIQGALVDGTFFPLHDRLKPPNPIMNVYQSSDGVWFVLVTEPDRWPALTTVVGHPELLKDPRFTDPMKILANSAQLAAILDEAFRSQPITHWREVLNQAHITYGLVREPSEVVKDPQLWENNIFVPIEGVGEHMKFTVSSPMQVNGVDKVPAKRGPEIGEHTDEVLKQLGFDTNQIAAFRANGTIPKPNPKVS